MGAPGHWVFWLVAGFLRWTRRARKRSCTTSTEEQTEPVQSQCFFLIHKGTFTEQLRRVATESAAARDAEPSLNFRLNRMEAGRRQSSMRSALSRAVLTARRRAEVPWFGTRRATC